MNRPETFQDYVGDFGNYSWVVLFVNAPLDAVSTLYAETLQREMVHNLPITASTTKQADQYDPTGAVVQVIDSDWVIIFHHVGRYIPLDSVSDFSQTLNAQVLVFAGEDTSGAVDCQLYSPGNPKTRYQTTEDFEEEAEIYEEMAEEIAAAGISLQPSTIIDSYEKLFESLGIQTIELTLDENRSKAFVSEVYQNKIQRVDLITQPL
ncbi:hypothetical protein [Acaryochloris sp. CCMEE 5410]|uniref:hypothetical protein n=1 Tax=Acaryochloris sp. CCMEE 5410 TaxID=310037 RepID=UPI00024846C3|nr:hypothetical protein [Acaryochloris sp. CCMEE 5410]KAI9135151.1 hypothetical protein ON05_019210 [Acaryochloris sp. CCMEE 5410]